MEQLTNETEKQESEESLRARIFSTKLESTNNNKSEKLLTVKELANLVPCSPTSICKYVQLKQLKPTASNGRTYFFHVEQIERVKYLLQQGLLINHQSGARTRRENRKLDSEILVKLDEILNRLKKLEDYWK